ncbi:hypothetical protein M8756_16080 [Lutimaribacter sp. EGI FJ00015]|uniref:Uncharacterized protein n=1 Tax=Lutimaribacter degradans TaxID=2945989 RepID=A0ACC5ZZ93_9RHOB|nr:hypothetical protein [Lutimaribacter sp. EGI FJ00013]MCM2563627.1 hypothetical protein [Lutimaribacter sp. EGI FJ00013]MCO0614837.1 hypothetical protein [Lutimaribacter sp. EGI FJ00015]MCO0637479.1 hypothetical protein [Lutimaribacter sp. EGI FJ00014]
MTQILLLLHILAGVAALAAAGIAVGSAKGGRLHRRSGNAYTLAMLIVGLSALVLAVANPNAFLFAVGVFSLYLVFTGWRAAMVRDGRPRRLDHAGGAVMALAGLGMLGWGAQGLLTASGAQPVILLAFGSIGLTMALADWRDWARGPITGKTRIARHLGRMLGGTIATITAAGVVNLGFLPDLVVWLGPTVVLTPVIFWWTARVTRGAVRT